MRLRNSETRLMMPDDLARLNEPYPETLEPTDNDAMEAIGLRLSNWTTLENEVWADFTENPPYGVGWWAPDPGTSRRILISDQLYCCLNSVASNMTEAKLHWLEYLHTADRDDARLSDVVRMTPTGPIISMPKPRSPYEQLLPDLMRMHQAGMVRALASALDCLAGVVIGVAALPLSILRADLARTRQRLATIARRSTVGTSRQAQFAAQLETAIAAAGPPGWLDWTLDFRNMLVHRGRRIELGQFVPINPVLYGPDGHPAPRARRISHLPRDPGRSDVEVFLDTPSRFVLHEDSRQTLEGLMRSTIDLIEATATHMRDLWRWRRENPTAIRQPEAQWPNGPSTQSTGFDGYQPNSLVFSPQVGMMHPVTARRFRAAALDDAARPRWTMFD